jgi:hypothetical protein
LRTALQFKKKDWTAKIGQIDLIAKLKKMFTGLKKSKVDQNAIIKD